MGKKKGLLIGLISMMLWLTTGAAWASGTQSGAVSSDKGQTDIHVGVVVDYMGKLKFLVRERNTLVPIGGASVELYISSLDRYVLFGLTDADGVYELDIAYNTDPNYNLGSQFVTVNGQLEFQGNLLFLDNNKIRYQVYKSGWLLYPTQGEETLTTKEIPQVIDVYLYKRGGGGDNGGTPEKPPGGGTTGGSGGGSSSPLQSLLDLLADAIPLSGLFGDEAGGIPKTGVEGAVPYWIAGFVFFLLAGGILFYLLKKEQDIKERERR